MTGKREMSAAIVNFPQKVRQELPYQCSACGADRGCDCNAPAIEKLAEKAEQDRKRAKAYRERKASRDAAADNAEKLPPLEVAVDPAPEGDAESPVAPEGLRNLTKFVNDTRAIAGRWPKVIKALASRRFDDEEWGELRKTLELLGRHVNAALSAIDAARLAPADPAGDMPAPGNDVDPEQAAERRKQEFAELDGALARGEAVALSNLPNLRKTDTSTPMGPPLNRQLSQETVIASDWRPTGNGADMPDLPDFLRRQA